MVRYLEHLEPRRGCGYRRVGKLYVVGSGMAYECHRLPLVLTVCPVCGSGIKHTRGWIRINPQKLFGKCPEEYTKFCPFCGGELKRETGVWVKCSECGAKINVVQYSKCTCIPTCYVCNPPEKAFMLWVGEKFYPTPQHFVNEALKLGVSKAIPSIPKGFELGKSIVYLAHRKTVTAIVENKMISIEGIFYAFIPLRFEYLVKKSDFEQNKDKYLEMEERGIEIVVVPDNYEEMVKKAEERHKRKRRAKKSVVGQTTLS